MSEDQAEYNIMGVCHLCHLVFDTGSDVCSDCGELIEEIPLIPNVDYPEPGYSTKQPEYRPEDCGCRSDHSWSTTLDTSPRSPVEDR